MLREISLIIISVAILFAGYTGAKKLRYWERSVWIFKISEQQERFDRRPRRYSDGPEGNRIENERNRDQHGRGGFRGGKKVSLRNVIWFLAVFAAFTVIIIYLDKLLFRRKSQA